MAYRPLEVTVISAKDLSNVNVFSKMEVYAVAVITGEERSKKKTPVDKEGGKNPTWNATLKFTVQEYDLQRAALHIVLKAERALGDREIGEVRLPIRELFEGWTGASGSLSGGDDDKRLAPHAQFVSYQVRKHSGKAKGVLNLSYKFDDLVPGPVALQVNADSVYAAGHMAAYPPPAGPAYPPPAGPAYPPPAGPAYPPPAGPAYPPPAAQNHGDPAQDKATQGTPKGSEPVIAYPAGPSAAYPPAGAYPYPPQPGYGYPPQHGYGYPPPGGYPGYGYPPPQQGGYGYPPPLQQGVYGYGGPVVQPQQQGKKKSKMGGAGLGLGLLGGAVGGLILGDMVSDAVSYDAGYDAGFDDGFGF